MARRVPVPHTGEELARIPILTVSQTAQLLERSEATIRRQLKQGRISGKQMNKQWYIPSAQFVLAKIQEQG